MKKNVGAIDKIIAELSRRDFLAQWNRITNKGFYKGNGFGKFQYTLGFDTMEAVELKRDYLNEKITEEEYKTELIKFWSLV